MSIILHSKYKKIKIRKKENKWHLRTIQKKTIKIKFKKC